MNLVLSDHRFLVSSVGFTAAALLAQVHSPRLKDMPNLATWIDDAADRAGISRELLCVVAQKEQSGLTVVHLSGWANEAFCGYGVTHPGERPKLEWRGAKNQLIAAAYGLRHLYDLADRAPNSWYAQVGKAFGPVSGVRPANRATAALYTYTPSVSDKVNLRRIWAEFNLGDPLEGPHGAGAPSGPPGGAPMSSGWESVHPDTAERLHAAGVTAADAIVQGVATTDDKAGHPSAGTHDAVGRIRGARFGHCIDLRPSAWRFTRAHFDALVAQGFAPFARTDWPDGAHWHVIDASGLRADDGFRPSHLAAVNNQLREWVNGGDGLVGDEPMPDEWRPTASQAAAIAKVWVQHTDFVLAGALKIIHPDGYALDGTDGHPNCHVSESGGVARADVAPIAEALGGAAVYRRQPQGPRIYLQRT